MRFPAAFFERLGYRWRTFTLTGFEHEPSTLRKRQIHSFWTFSSIIALIFLAFSADHLFSPYGVPAIGRAYLVAAVLIVLNLALLRRTRRFWLCKVAFFAILIGTLEILLTTGGSLQAGILWFYIFPPIAFFLTGRRNALRLIASLYVVTGAVYAMDGLGVLTIPYAALTMRQFGLSFLFVSLLIYFQERGRERDELLLLRSERELRESFSQLQAEVLEREAAERQLANRTKKLETANRSLEVSKRATAKLLEQVKQAKNELESRNDLLELLQDVAVAANKAKTSGEAYGIALRRITLHTGWIAGYVFRVDAAGVPHPDLWYARPGRRLGAFRKATEDVAHNSSDSLLDQVITQRRAAWVDAAGRSKLKPVRRKAAVASGIKTVIMFPVVAHRQVVGVVELYSAGTEREDAALVRTLEHIGHVLGQVVEREEAATGREQLAALVQSSADAIIGKDLNGTILSWNRGAEEMYGYKAREVVGKSIGILFPPERTDELKEIMGKLRRGQPVGHSTRRYETERLRKDGQRIVVALSISPIRDSRGTITGASTIARDVTAQRRVDQMKTDFVSLVSHQLRTPVGQIRGYIENLLAGVAGDLNERQCDYLQDMLSISIENYDLIADLLNVSRLERGVVHITMADVSLQEVVQSALRNYRGAITHKGLKLTVDFPSRDVVVRADAAKLSEALRNIINNAFKFTKRGRIAVTVGRKDGQGIITVADTGPGIPPEERRWLFTRRQILSGKPHPQGGAGLGLYIAKNFMTLQQGTVTARSRTGRGTTFVFSIPLAKRTIKRSPGASRKPKTKAGQQ